MRHSIYSSMEFYSNTWLNNRQRNSLIATLLTTAATAKSSLAPRVALQNASLSSLRFDGPTATWRGGPTSQRDSRKGDSLQSLIYKRTSIRDRMYMWYRGSASERNRDSRWYRGLIWVSHTPSESITSHALGTHAVNVRALWDHQPPRWRAPRIRVRASVSRIITRHVSPVSLIRTKN